MALPRILGTQIGLREPELVDRIKADMKAGRYGYEERRGQIGGVCDPRGRYCVVEGHHRMVAAIELFQETGDDTAVRSLLFWGRWTDLERPPSDRRPLPFRDWWGRWRNWLGL